MDQKNGSVFVDVKDEGIGIPVEAQERVFDRFYRGEDALVLATPGTGLGLSIVKQLVEMHNGKIWLKSTGDSRTGQHVLIYPAGVPARGVMLWQKL